MSDNQKPANTYERNKQAADKLAREIKEHSGCSSEQAARKAAEIARSSDNKRGK